MTAYIVTYDLRSPGRNYNSLYERIRSYPRWARITESSWAVSGSNQSAVQIRDYLRGAIDGNDQLFVGVLGSSAWFGLDPDVSKWLKNNI